MAKTAMNPEGLPVPRGSYSLVTIAQPGRMVFVAGQTASDPQGNIVGVGDARAQTRYIIEKIKKAVEAAGGTLNDVVAMNIFTPTCAIIETSTKRDERFWGLTFRPAPWSRSWLWRDLSCC